MLLKFNKRRSGRTNKALGDVESQLKTPALIRIQVSSGKCISKPWFT